MSSFQKELEGLLDSIYSPINKVATKLLYFKVEGEKDTTADKLSRYLCNNRGHFLVDELSCACDIGVFGSHCEIKGIDKWKKWFTFFQVAFGITFGIVAIIMWWSLISKIISDIKVKDQLKRMLITPKYLVIFNLVIISTMRFFFIVLDPFCQHEILSHETDTILYYLIIASYISFYLQVLTVWMGINSVFKLGMGKISKQCFVCLYNKTKMIFVAIMILIYPAQIVYCFCQSKRYTTNEENLSIVIVGAVIFFLLLIFTVYLMISLKLSIKEVYPEEVVKSTFEIKVKKKNDEDNLNDGSPVENADKIKNKKDIMDFLGDVIENNRIKIIEDYVLDRNQSSFFNEQVESRLDYEKEMVYLDLYQEEDAKANDENYKTSRLEEDSKLKIALPHPSSSVSSIRRVQSSSKKTQVNPLTKNDKKVIQKIYELTYCFHFLTFVNVFLMIGIAFEFFKNYGGCLVALFLSFILEIITMLIVYNLFFKDIRLQEYQNLKIIGEIDKYIHPDGEIEEPEIVFKEFTRSGVYDRFKSFVKGLEE